MAKKAKVKPKFKVGDKVRSSDRGVSYGRVVEVCPIDDRGGSRQYIIETNDGQEYPYEHFLQEVTLTSSSKT
ncbi:MAG: hypothetical protein ACXABY_29955 [Candidatus Thorarchaeota archaeon]